MTKRYMKRDSTSLISREIKIKTAMRRHHTPVKIAVFKRQEIMNVGKDVEKREPLGTLGENVNWCNHYVEQYGRSLKN